MNSSAASAGAEPSAERRAPSAAIPVVCGPTAAGKSDVALWLAARCDVMIISADSRQVYRGFDAGTGKPTAAERQRVPHRGIDVADPTQRYSAAAWTAMAHQAIDEALAAGRVPLVVGGTGFYIGALFRPLWDEPVLDANARAGVQRALADLETAELRRWCQSVDPPRAHLGRAQLLRAIEIALLTGRRISDLHRTSARQPRHSPCYLLVDPGMTLGSRIAARAAAMFNGGWVDEVRRLARDVPETAPAWNATGYRTVRRAVAGELEPAAAIEHITVETRQYAKRQRTWFRHQLANDRVERLTPDSPGWEKQVLQWFDQFAGRATHNP